ncbi:MAG: glycosyltransferase [Terriglobia bacterium]
MGGEDWWYHHPHSKTHLLKRLARSNRILFVNSISLGLPRVSQPDFFLKIRRKLGSYRRYLRVTPEGIVVLTPLVIPAFGSAAIRRLNRTLLGWQLRRVLARYGFSRPLLWIAIPTAADLVGRLDEQLVIYQVSDKYEANIMDHNLSPGLIQQFHRSLLERADLVFYSGRKLYEEAESFREKSHFLEQGVDFDHFARADDLASEPPADLADLPRPILGYFGALDFVIDQELVRTVTARRPHWSWVFIGLKSNALTIERLPNVRVLPPRPYTEMPRYAAAFDVCVLPWDIRNPFVAYGSAIKVREYLASGKPVVLMALPEYKPLAGVLRMAHDYDGFIAHVESALAERDAEAARRRQEAVRTHTWDARSEQLSGWIEQALREKSTAATRA